MSGITASGLSCLNLTGKRPTWPPKPKYPDGTYADFGRYGIFVMHNGFWRSLEFYTRSREQRSHVLYSSIGHLAETGNRTHWPASVYSRMDLSDLVVLAAGRPADIRNAAAAEIGRRTVALP